MIIKSTKAFELKATIGPSVGGTHSFVLSQCWPQAQRPEWRRLCQLNLSDSELDALASAIIRRSE